MAETQSILLLEDDAGIANLLAATLGQAGFSVASCRTLRCALDSIAQRDYALLIIDLGLPDGDGTELIRTVRTRLAVPVIVLSARLQETEKVRCLDLGADDYLVKPFGMDELMARVRAVLRRANAATSRPQVFERDGLLIDSYLGIVRLRGAEVHLTPIEQRLLFRLAAEPGRVLTHRQLLADVWGNEHVDATHYLRIHMGRLRAKLEQDTARPRYIRTEAGVGYRLCAD